MARVLVDMGINKVRLTGGEPLLRKGVVEFVRELASLRPLNGNRTREPLDIALTTNGHMLAELAQPLKDAGLTRVTVSMDAVDPDRFARITRVPEWIRSRAGRNPRGTAGGFVAPESQLRADAGIQ